MDKIFTEVKNDIEKYLELRLELLKLQATRKFSSVASYLISDLVMILLLFFLFLFGFIALGFYLGELLGSFGHGFLLVMGVFLVCSLLLLFFKKSIRAALRNRVINTMLLNEDEAEKDEKIYTAAGVDEEGA